MPLALDLLRGTAVRLPFVRTVGDEIQGVVASSEAVVEATLLLQRQTHWSVGVGVGRATLTHSAPASRGPAFIHARTAVERARGRAVPAPVAVAADDGEGAREVEALLQLLASITRRRTDAQWRVLDSLATGASGVAAARTLGVSPQNVSSLRRGAMWDEEQAVRPLLVRLLDELEVGAR